MPGPVNRHDKLREGELPRRYWRLRYEDRTEPTELDPDPYEGWVDEYWDPWCGATPRDFHLQQVWEQILAVAFAPGLAVGAEERPRTATSPAARWSPEELPAALHDHLERALGRATAGAYLDELRSSSALADVRATCRHHPTLARWFAHQRGAGVMLLVLAPFWIRSLADWAPPATTDFDDLTESLVEHLLVRYPLPRPLLRAWHGCKLPALKWACWTVLLGGGASLARAAPRFDWRIASRFTHFLLAAPAELDILDAVMSAEISRLGGSATELARLRAHPAYCLDPTAPDGARDDDDDDDEDNVLDAATTRREFWRATAWWLARHRDALTDEQCVRILDWAMHRHTEDLRAERPENACFRWSGREPAPALEEATRYAEQIRGWFPFNWFRGGAPLAWKSRGWNREDGPWAVRELTSDTELADEGRAMHHCVATYAFLCAQGQSAIFSLTHDGARRATVQIDPRTRRIVQARGARNRPCDREELAALDRWIASLT